MHHLYKGAGRYLVILALFAMSALNVSAQWTKLKAMFPNDAEIGFASQAAVGGKLYNFGGVVNGSSYSNKVLALDLSNPDANWEAVATMPTARISSGATVLNGKIYVVGGYYANGQTRVMTPAVLEFDPATNKVTAKANMTTPLYNSGVVTVGNKIYCVAGATSAGAASKVCMSYDPASDTWKNEQATILAMNFTTACAVGQDIYLIGGYTGTALSSGVYKGTVPTDATAKISWSSVSDLPAAWAAPACGVNNGKIYVAGGDNGTLSNFTYRYDEGSDTWEDSYRLPVATAYTKSLVSDGTNLYFIGGNGNKNTYKLDDSKSAPAASVNPSSVDFQLKTGTEKIKTIAVSNFGVATLNVEVSTPSADKWLSADMLTFTVAPGESQTIEITANSDGMTQGKYTSSVTLTTNDDNNKTISVPVSMGLYDQVATRRPFLEVFTSSTCPPCKPGNETLHSVIDQMNRDSYTVLKFQQDFPGTGDPYCTDETVNRRGFYAINSIPRMEIDGAWDENAQSFTEDVYKTYQEEICFLNIGATHSVNGKTVKVKVDLNPLADYSSSNLVLHCAIAEKRTEKNVKTNGETEFLDVVKKMLPNENGTALSAMTAGVATSKELEFTFNGNYRLPSNGQAANRIKHATENSVEDFSNFEVVVWVQDKTTKQVHQSAWSAPVVSSVMDDMNAATELSIAQNYPNPANANTNIAYALPVDGKVSIEITDLSGNKVATLFNGLQTKGAHSITYDASAVPSGAYTITVSQNGKTVSKVMNVVH